MSWIEQKAAHLLSWVGDHLLSWWHLPTWTDQEAATVLALAAITQAALTIAALGIAIYVPWRQQRQVRDAEQKTKALELASLRLALHSEVGATGRQCIRLSVTGQIQRSLPPLTILQANAGKIGLLTREEVLNLVGLSSVLFDMSVFVNDETERLRIYPAGKLNVSKWRWLCAEACRHAAEFLVRVPDIPGTDQDRELLAQLKKRADDPEHDPNKRPI
jgi:hypothetical protein